MNYLDAIILGILQGLTEFLPVSSSGHLVLAQALLKVSDTTVGFEILLHLGTLLSVLVYFRTRILALIKSIFTSSMSEERKVVLYLIVGTIPAGLAGVLFEDFFERAFSSPGMTSAMLVVTGIILLVSTRFVQRGEKKVGLLSTIVIGIGQALAIMPGISRSGSTISFGLLAKVKPSEAAEFSFLLAIPAILGAAVFKFDELEAISQMNLGPSLVGFILAFAFGLLAVYTVLATIRRGRFEYFAYYCFAAGALGLYLFL